MPALCAIADEVTKVHAICVKCGDLAYVSHRTVANDKRVLLGEKEEYEPLCRCCYRKAVEEAKKGSGKPFVKIRPAKMERQTGTQE